MAKPPAVESIHALIAPADTLLTERRALYSLAAELLCPDVTDDLPDHLLDSPPVRFHMGEALAGRAHVSLAQLAACHAGLGETRSAHGLQVVARAQAHDPLDPVLRIIEPRPGLRLLTEDNPRFESAFEVVAEGVRLARELSPSLFADLSVHVDLLAVLDPDTSHGLVSASSRWFPGLVLIDAPATPIEVAEGLVHEGAHQKFFDFAITRSFFGFEADTAEYFETSWSHARWPMEQTVAAWHAYTCMHKFAVDSGVASGQCPVGPSSLLPEAEKRAGEIGGWLLQHVDYLQEDARVLLNGLLMDDPCTGREKVSAKPNVSGCLKPNPLVRFAKREQQGRLIVAKAGNPPELFWVEPDEGQVLQLISARADGLDVDEIVAHQAALWDVEPGMAQERVATGLRALLDSGLVSST